MKDATESRSYPPSREITSPPTRMESMARTMIDARHWQYERRDLLTKGRNTVVLDLQRGDIEVLLRC